MCPFMQDPVKGRTPQGSIVQSLTCSSSAYCLLLEARNLMHVLAVPYIEIALKCIKNRGQVTLSTVKAKTHAEKKLKHVSPFQITRLQLFLILMP